MFERASAIDMSEGMLAYDRYHMVMRSLAQHYGFTLEQTIAVFVSLSPNSDYKGNLRSTVSVLDGINKGKAPEEIIVSTYSHCKNRAYAYARGYADFVDGTKGPKIMNFYHNVLDPKAWRYVTVDGHMVNIWRGTNVSMKDSLVRRSEYTTIHSAISALAFKHYMLPNQMQAVLWFTRKRVSNVVYDPQLKLFGDPTDVWETVLHVDSIKPYHRAERSTVSEAEDNAQGWW